MARTKPSGLPTRQAKTLDVMRALCPETWETQGSHWSSPGSFVHSVVGFLTCVAVIGVAHRARSHMGSVHIKGGC